MGENPEKGYRENPTEGEGGGKGNENKKMTKQRNKCGRRNVKVKTRM